MSRPLPLPPPLPYGDVLSHQYFRKYFGFGVPGTAEGWIKALWEGPFLPYKNPNPDVERLLVLLEAAQKDNYDIITELVLREMWDEAVWVVRVLLEPRGGGYSEGDEGPDVLVGVVYTALGGGKLKPKIRKGEERHVAGIGGRSGLWALRREIKRDVARRRRGLSVILGSLGMLVLRAGETKGVEAQKQKQLPQKKTTKKSRRKETAIPSSHTDCLPTARQILAYIHTSGLVPLSVYSSTQYPRLHYHRSKILTSMADAVWRAQEAFVAREAEQMGVYGEHRGMEVPRARLRLTTWGSGTKDTFARPKPSKTSSNEKRRKMEFGAFAEREIWMELIMALVNEGGFGIAGTFILKNLFSRKYGGWSFVNYATLRPKEYKQSYIRLATPDEKEGVVADWGLEGYSLVKPQLHTFPRTLPEWVIHGVVNALVNTHAESRNIEVLLEHAITIAQNTPRHLLRRSNFGRILRMPETIAAPAKAIAVTGYIAKLEGILGDPLKQLEALYTSLDHAITYDTPKTAIMTWSSIVNTTKTICHPDWIAGKYLMALVRARELMRAYTLLTHKNPLGETAIPLSSYHHPSVAPGILALAVTTGDKRMLEKASAAIRESGGTHAMFSSLMNAYLRFGRIEQAHSVLVFMRDHGVEPDAADVGLLVENELRRDVKAGYRLVEAACGTKPPKILPAGAFLQGPANRPGIIDTTLESMPPPDDEEIPVIPGVKPKVGISRDAWYSVLDTAVSSTDPYRTKWALDALGVNLASSQGMDTRAFNVLLKSAVLRRGAYEGMLLCRRYWINAPSSGPTAPSLARGNLLSIRTVLHQANREMDKLDRVALYEATKHTKPEELEGKLRKDWEEKQLISKTLWWCWSEMRRLGAAAEECEQVLWKEVNPVRVER